MSTNIRHGDYVNNRYKILRILGKGTFGETFAAFDTRLNEIVAIKIQDKSNMAINELNCLKIIHKELAKSYKRFVVLLDHFVLNERLYLVLEYLDTTLKNKLSKEVSFHLSTIKKISTYLVEALHYLYILKMIHGDLKPENIAISEINSQLKLIDFGTSSFTKDCTIMTLQTRFYRSPEVFFHLIPYTTAVDMWSLGCILVELYTGSPLFNAITKVQQIQQMADVLGPPPHHLLSIMNRRKFLLEPKYNSAIFRKNIRKVLPKIKNLYARGNTKRL